MCVMDNVLSLTVLFMHMSYGVAVCNRFACLLVEPTPDDDCADPNDCPDPSSDSGSVSSSHGSLCAVLLVSKAENSGDLCLSHSFSSSTSIDRELSPSPCLLSSSDDANSGDCATVAAPDGLRDLIYFTFNNLSSCNLPSMVEQFSESVEDIYLPWVAVYLVERASIEPNFHALYLRFLDHLANSSLYSLTLMESYRRVGLAVNADLSFDLSFDRVILNNLGHWLGLQTLARGVPVCADTLPLSDIVLTASRRGPQDLQLAVPFVAQIFMAASSSVAFQPSLPCFRELLSLLARLHMYPHVGLRCSLEIEILFNHLSLQLSDFQSSSEYCQQDATFSVHGMCEDEHREHEESIWSSMKREAVLPSDLCRMSLMKHLSATTTGNTMTARRCPCKKRRRGQWNNRDLEGCNLRR